MVKVKYVNIDDWNRPIFKDKLGNYFGATDILFPYQESEGEVLKKVTEKDLTFFGRKFNCEPMGDPIKGEVVILSTDKELA